MEDALYSGSAHLEPYVNINELRQSFQRFMAGRTDADVTPLWMAVVLGTWLRMAETSGKMRQKLHTPSQIKAIIHLKPSAPGP